MSVSQPDSQKDLISFSPIPTRKVAKSVLNVGEIPNDPFVPKQSSPLARPIDPFLVPPTNLVPTFNPFLDPPQQQQQQQQPAATTNNNNNMNPFL